MESDKRYFFEGLFIIVFTLAAAAAFVWLAKTGHRDDVMYRIRFNESVSGMTVGDTVKFRGVDMGTVKAMTIDETDPRRVQVEVRLRKEAPVKTDTKASLKLKGITGAVFIELDGGSPNAQLLVAATSAGQVPGDSFGEEQALDRARAVAAGRAEVRQARRQDGKGAGRRRRSNEEGQGEPFPAAQAAQGAQGAALRGETETRGAVTTRRGSCEIIARWRG